MASSVSRGIVRANYAKDTFVVTNVSTDLRNARDLLCAMRGSSPSRSSLECCVLST